MPVDNRHLVTTMKVAAKVRFVLVLATALSNQTVSRAVFANETRVIQEGATKLAYLSPSLSLQVIRQTAAGLYAAAQFDLALERYKTICESGAATAEDFYWLGETYFHMHKYSESAISFEKVITLNPQADKVRVRIVQAYIGTNPAIATQKCLNYLSVATDTDVRKQLQALLQYCNGRTSRGAQSRSQIRNVER